ncbi:MAG: M23 family metallopeptidase [Chloroflexi bacterium]|nr:M23 family metallopeptidase [Chloroflexota bacterium]
MRLLFACLVILLLVLSLLGSGVINLDSMPPERVPASITQWWGLIEASSNQYDVDPFLVAAVMMQESGGNPDSRSSAGANGLMQVLNGPFEPTTNVDRGVAILARNLQMFQDVRVALAAYNAGPGLPDADAVNNATIRYAGVRGAARKAGVPAGEFDKYVQYLPAETRRYVPAVMAYYDRFRGGPVTVNQYDGIVRYPLDKFTWFASYGRNTGNGQPWHTGEDLSAPCGTAVKAAFDGDVVYRGCLYGNCKDGGVANGATGHGLVVIQQFEPDKYAVYAHLASYVSDKSAKAGDVVGFIGMTGFTRGCHLHYAIWQGGLDDLLKGNGRTWLDPKKFFPNQYHRPTPAAAAATVAPKK